MLLQSYCQNMDSLKERLSATQGKEKCDILFKIIYGYANKDNIAAVKYANQVYDEAFLIGDTFRIIKAIRVKGQGHRRLDELFQSLEYLKEGIPIAERHLSNREILEEYNMILGAIAITYIYLADYDKALEFNYKALAIREKGEDKGEMAIIHNNIGLVYYKLLNYESALKHYRLALGLKHESEDYYDLDRLFMNIGLCYNELNSFNEALKSFDEGFDVCKDKCSDRIMIEGKFGQGVAYYEMKEFNRALLYFQTSYRISERAANKRWLAENLLYSARVYFKLGKNNEGIDMLKQAERILLVAPYNQVLVETYEEMYKFYNGAENYSKASFYMDKYIALREIIYNEEMTTNLMKIEAKNEERENLAKISSQKQVLTLKEEVIVQHNIRNIFVGCIAFTLVVITAILYQSNRHKRMVNNLLDSKVKERALALEQSQEALLKISKEKVLLLVRTSQDMHDSLVGIRMLSTVSMEEISDSAARQYISKMNLTFEQLELTIKKLQSIE